MLRQDSEHVRLLYIGLAAKLYMALKTGRLEVRCSPTTEAAFEHLANQSGVRPSHLLRTIVEHVLKNAGLENQELPPPPEKEKRSERVAVRFSKREMEAIEALSENFGGPREWLVALARSKITPAAPQFSLKEVQALYESNRELWAIGRNINQIAHAMNLDMKQAGRLDGSSARLKELEGLKALIDSHTAFVMGVCNASLDRWSDT